MAVKGIRGSLASADLIEQLAGHAEHVSGVRRCLVEARTTIGPASTARQIFDRQIDPLIRELGLVAHVLHTDATVVVGELTAAGVTVGMVSAGAWDADLRRLRDRAGGSTPVNARWWIGANGSTLRVMDVSRAYTRRALDFDLLRLEDDDRGLAVLRRILAPAVNGSLDALSSLVGASEQHCAAVGRSLQTGVEDALGQLVQEFSKHRRRARDAARAACAARLDNDAFADALTIVYRILFLLFAEARGLVPQWHPVYRDSYTIESLRPMAEARESPAGLWQSLQAISRLAHRGCTAGSLRVVPFNGRLFAPAAAPIAESFVLDDRVARDVLLALTTRRSRDRRERISYMDLGVEQLGAVYERVLDYTPGDARRKPTGTFYTPRAMTEYLVRRTLAPLTRGRSPEAILALRVLDPAMGSGAFLVAACRYLADAYEEALIADGTVCRADITAAERAGFRRVVAQRCLYGVDVNPTAVQLARLSLWLCTLAADRPLSFLDHHLRTGNSLVGAEPADLTRQRPGRGTRRTPGTLPLFDADDLSVRIGSSVGIRTHLATTPDETAAVVRRKERMVEDLAGTRSPVAAWRTVADAWCAAWFWPAGARPLDTRAWTAFAAALRGESSELPERLAREWRERAAAVAARERFFHWQIEFPEIFFDEHGRSLERAGFDAVIGNPPWAEASGVAAFSRESGCYALQGSGHANLYQLFAERMLQLTTVGGRLGMLMPSGLLADHGNARLRQHLFERCTVDVAFGFDNRDRIFPIHRGLRFSLITATAGGATSELRLRTGVRDPSELEDVPDHAAVSQAVAIPVELIRRFSGAGLAVPELECARDRAILAHVVASAPPLGSDDGWNARFGRELNATDDRPHFGAHGLPVLEGKHIEPFRTRIEEAAQFIEPSVARRLLGRRVQIDRARLGYREVASATNRLTLIAAVIPAGTVTTHTVFCLRTPDHEPLHWFLCGIFNSFTANYLIRLRGGTHVPAAAIHQLPVPVLSPDSTVFSRIVALSRGASDDVDARAEIHGLSAAAYALDEDAFVHIIGTFPLVPEQERTAALAAFRRIRDAI